MSGKIPWVWVAVLLVLTTILAGCVDGDEDVLDPGEGTGDGPGDGDETDTGQGQFLFAWEESVHEVVWANGTFELQETGIAGGFMSGEYQAVVDLTDRVPAGVPVDIAIEVSADAGELPMMGSSFYAQLQTNGALWYGGSWDQAEPGVIEQDAQIMRMDGGVVEVVMEAYAPDFEGDGEIAYSLHATVEYDPMKILPGVPVATPLEANETVELHALSEGGVDVLVFDPDDAFVTRLEGGEGQEFEAGGEGNYVFTVTWESAPVQIVGEQEENRTLEPLFFDWDVGAGHSVEPQEGAEWTFESTNRPLRVGVYVANAGEPWATYGGIEVTVRSPEGDVIAASGSCDICFWDPFGFFGGSMQWAWFTMRGDEALVPGTYEVSVDNDLWFNFETYHVVEHYRRGDA